MTNKRLTILFIPLNFLGHLNPMIGFAQNFISKHRVVFAVSQKSKGQLKQYGFEEEEYEIDDSFFNMDRDKIKEVTDERKVLENCVNPMDQWRKWAASDKFINTMKSTDVKVKDVVDRVKPDLVVADVALTLPSAIRNYPWINLITPNPSTSLCDERCPPPCCGKIVSYLCEVCLIIF